MKRTIAAALAAWLLCTTAAPAAAAVNVERSGSENPMVELSRSILYGGLAGVMVGGAIALATESDDTSEILRWSLVTGTLVGLGFGLHYVTHRPQAMLEIEDGETRLGLVTPEVGPDGVRMRLVGVTF